MSSNEGFKLMSAAVRDYYRKMLGTDDDR